MKLNWIEPSIKIENFQPDEYVAACVTGTIQCAYPGNGSRFPWENTNGRTDIFDDYNGRESGWYTDGYGMQHGVCGNDATISFNGNTGSGFEYVNGRHRTAEKDRSIVILTWVKSALSSSITTNFIIESAI